ncbi:MAG: class I SAM-dependent rRNA methyltransferase [Candidatus Rhabdochlamydia sp.]
MSYVILKEGKEKSILNKHPWIFSGAIQSRPSHAPGDIFPVYSFQEKLLGHAYFHPENSIAGRMINFDKTDPLVSLAQLMKQAILMRDLLVLESARRLINAESDELPGLIVDQYEDTLVISISTWGMERLKSHIIKNLKELCHPKAIYEKSVSAARRQEGLVDTKGLLYGEAIKELWIKENGLSFLVRPLEGQKTGFFIDQREMRKEVCHLSQGARVLNCFAYTGGFSLSALKGGAISVTSVEISEEACHLMKRHAFDEGKHTIQNSDVFTFLEEDPLDFDLVILDPPAFVKKRQDIAQASSGYRELHRHVFQKMPAQSILVTSSCSAYMDQDLFQQIIFQAAAETGRHVRILRRHIQAFDHPVSLYHPEGDYLKSLILFLE